MSTFLDNLYKNQSTVYKYFIYILSTVLIVFFFPKGGKFKYEFQKGKPWQYDNYYAPVDFSIKKSDDDIEKEKAAIKNRQIPYYSYDKEIAKGVYAAYASEFKRLIDGLSEVPANKDKLYDVGENILNVLYEKGVSNDAAIKSTSNSINLIRNNEEIRINSNQLFTKEDLDSVINVVLKRNNVSNLEKEYQRLLFEIVEPNVFQDRELSKKVLEDAYSKLSYTRGTVDQGKLIIAKGEVVESENYKILSSLKSEYESELWTSNNYYFILFGYSVLVALVLMMLLLFLKKYRKDIYKNNTKVTFIFFNILIMVFVTTLVVKYNEAYVFVVPLCILPLILKTFFDARLGLFVHVLAVLILGFVVPNSFEYVFLQIITGIVTILTVSELYKRANLFISVGQIILIYIVAYFAFHIIHEGNLDNVQWLVFGLFLLNGMITLFVQPLIYIYEKVFGLVSDVSLLELSDTNSRLLKELSNKAPGTFHHSLQVANLAEAAANEIGANAMLVRVGALYHDIGKMNNPTYFTENQITNVNPHDELAPIDSAKIIIDHVIGGIELARKNNLPDRIIDFIRVHHGTTLVYYFYKKQLEIDGEVNEKDFRYPGPTPFSKETAILMMADSIEAASKSLKNPTFLIIDEFVNKIISGQMNANQFLNANITFKEIEAIKKVMKQKLTNIYHLRVEYPE
ncbi:MULTISPECIES: HD family phosphohydrolase [unclassified Cellulophaga]|uniref:HD family phosphohydrolase n=1 Tax=unclassified Cellulophaga TaxID=2634405 RepID=UPI001C4E69B2|nr:HDIG domain-containing metalloprotein [Cellulophaga sp. HaHa_2_1]QXP52323.1 HDIG domain-containing protein [Cellulophaga sp. HaHa_2_1]